MESALATPLAELEETPLAAPDAPRLAALGLGPRELAADAREERRSSRRVVVPLLELLAARGLTVRHENGTHSVV